jgi:hypothetical protein
MTRRTAQVRSALIVATAIAATSGLARRRYLRWGATDEEAAMDLPGDQFLPVANVTATRAITILRTADDVWPWLAQLGQGRGGFYSYDFLENLVGCDIQSADRIVEEWQSIEVGSEVNLYPGFGLMVAHVEPGRSLVLRGGAPMGGKPAPYDFTWAFVLTERPDGTTRLLVRERYEYTRRWSGLIVEPVELISFVMSQKMLRGIRDRAKAAPPRPAVDIPVPRTDDHERIHHVPNAIHSL